MASRRPVLLDPLQRIVNVSWAGLLAVVECYANSGNALGGQLNRPGSIELGCSFPSFTPPNVDPTSIEYEFPPSKELRADAETWSEPFLIGDPVAQDQSIHTFTVNMGVGDSDVTIFDVTRFGASNLHLNFVTHVVIRLFSHIKWRKVILGNSGGIDIIARNGPVIRPQAGSANATKTITSTNPASGATKAEITLDRKKKTAAVAWV